jgi:hypothetical protein
MKIGAEIVALDKERRTLLDLPAEEETDSEETEEQ